MGGHWPTSCSNDTLATGRTCITGRPLDSNAGNTERRDDSMSFSVYLAISRLDVIRADLQNVDGDVDRMVKAADALDAEATAGWLPILYEWLATKDDFYLRESAARPIARLEGIASLRRLLAAHHLGSIENHDNDCLTAILIDLVEAHRTEARAQLLDLAASSNPTERSDAAWLLGFVHGDMNVEVLEALVTLTADPVADVRSRACGSLGSYKGVAAAFEALVRCLQDPDQEVVTAAANALGYFGDKRALPLLESLRQSFTERQRLLIDHAILMLRGDGNFRVGVNTCDQ